MFFYDSFDVAARKSGTKLRKFYDLTHLLTRFFAVLHVIYVYKFLFFDF